MINKRMINAFCKKHGLTVDQFYGREEIKGDLYLSSLTSIPEGFNPTVGGWLDLRSLTSIPEGFNPTVGGWLDLSSLPRNERAKVVARRPAGLLRWQDGKYILSDGVFSEVVSHKGNIYRTRQIGKERVEYLVTDGKGKWAHGQTLREARADLVYKIGDSDTSKYKGMTLATKLGKAEAIEAYRVITGACSTGARMFVEGLGKVKASYTVAEIIEMTNGRYGNEAFAKFFGGAA